MVDLGKFSDGEILKKLSAQPPVPAGEGFDTLVLTKNIFYLL